MAGQGKISVLILTHNATDYVRETFETLFGTTDKDTLQKIETVVVDNASKEDTRALLHSFNEKGYITKLHLSDENTMFAKGNNIASRLADPNSDYYLLLNSDVSIRDKNWLRKLVQFKEEGRYAAASYGFCKKPDRADGYCFLIDKNLYDKYLLDEKYDWFYGLTKLQANIVREGRDILAISYHNKLLVHYGGKSGNINMIKAARGMDTKRQEILSWFSSSEGKVIEKKYDYLAFQKTQIKKAVQKLLGRKALH